MLVRALTASRGGGGDNEWVVGTTNDGGMTYNFSWDFTAETAIVYGHFELTNYPTIMGYWNLSSDLAITALSGGTDISNSTWTSRGNTVTVASDKKSLSFGRSAGFGFHDLYLMPLKNGTV